MRTTSRSLAYFSLCIGFSFVTYVYGKDIVALSCEGADVQTALDSAEAGDVVLIPEGTCMWNTTVGLDVDFNLTVKGSGIDSTIIIDNVYKNNVNVLISFVLYEGNYFRLTGFTIQGYAQDQDWYNKGQIQLVGTCKKFRLDHIKFDSPGTSGVRYYGWLYGVVDHCLFLTRTTCHQGNVVWHETMNGGYYGDGSWNTDSYFGTDKAIYFEDNVFLGCAHTGAGVLDSYGGGRTVFRHNNVTDEFLPNHGTESSGRVRGVRTFEIYDNTFETGAFMYCAIYLRGGTGVVFNNSMHGAEGQTGYQYGIMVANYRCYGDYLPWGQANGNNTWDGNVLSDGWPCLDQVGRGKGDLISGDDPVPKTWPNQISEPLYVWNNTWTPVPWNPGAGIASQNDVIAADRDWYTIPKPGYTPYVYPHPLVSGNTDDHSDEDSGEDSGASELNEASALHYATWLVVAALALVF